MPKVFISYVRENANEVEKLAEALRTAGIDVWFDKTSLPAGVRWKSEIRKGIESGDFFIACFSEDYAKRAKSFMNEEIILAIDELRLRSTDRRWFIPVLLTDTFIPHRDIGGGETLRDLQWVSLYDEWEVGIDQIISAILPAKIRVTQLIQELDSASARKRIKAADELGKYGSEAREAEVKLTELLDDENDTVRAIAVEALGKIGIKNEKFVGALLKIMRQGEYYSSSHAADSLGRMGKLAVPALREACSFPGNGIASKAYNVLESIEDPEAFPELIQALNEGIPIIRPLGKFKHRREDSIPILLHILRTDSCFYKRSMAAEALGELKSAEAVEDIIQILAEKPLEQDQKIEGKLPGRVFNFTGEGFYWGLKEALGQIATPKALEWLEGNQTDRH